MARIFKTHSVAETLNEAEIFTKNFLKPGCVLCLSGDLGSGKTHFVKGVARALNIHPGEVQSPTFTLINEYYGEIPLYHFDCYRLEHDHEFMEIGAEDYLYGQGISVIEWPEKVEHLLPDNAIWLYIESRGLNKRVFKVENKHIKPDI